MIQKSLPFITNVDTLIFENYSLESNPLYHVLGFKSATNEVKDMHTLQVWKYN